ncbi:MAG: metal-dependent hydrolase [Rhodobacter sp.]|jgi:inner membrane protein|nr:metal-dependent hydrolase [Rhodobacter sp.]MCA3452731.1 metal-dependent hydrolase [Rhodobacter sp.]MCA3457450.1 metal-dependent hydrolase [Rhodobacter sp.]MCA3460309.1 metal-dependent hydrolase [Rhodobacter sp.]MCA3465826.1 metal-dependent hydrolase [Rhodobacter sp.]
MFIAHIPAGYLLARYQSRDHPDRKALILTGIAASVLPDTDLLWFYLVDQRQTVHHSYVFHWPLFWLGCAVCAWAVARVGHWNRLYPFIRVTLACLLLHMVLDSIAAEIGWLQPFASYEVNLVEVPARYGWWVWNFILHWTFLAELAIVLAAGIMLWRDMRPAPARQMNHG